MSASHARSGGPSDLSSGVSTTVWTGWLLFAAIMLIMLGTFHAITGFVALFRESYFAVSDELLIHIDYSGWGWIHIIAGVLVVAAGIGLMVGRMWARIIAVAVAALSAFLNLAFIAAHPLWSAIVIAIAVISIYAVTVHGSETEQFSGDTWQEPAPDGRE